MSDEEKKAVQIMIEAAKDAEYLEDAMLLGYRALKEHKYPKPPEIDMSKVKSTTYNLEAVESFFEASRILQERQERMQGEQSLPRSVQGNSGAFLSGGGGGGGTVAARDANGDWMPYYVALPF